MSNTKADLASFCRNSTIHGVQDLYESRSKCFRAFWLLLFIGASAATIYGCYKILHQYTDTPFYVSYVVRDSTNLLIPDVIVCPFNRLNKSFLTHHNVSRNLTEYIQMSFGMSPPYRFENQIITELTRPNSDIELDRLLDRLGTTFGEFIENGAISCQSLIRYCFGSNKKKFHNCCENATSIWTGVGKCFRIPGTDQMSAGYGFGNTIVITLPKELYTPSVSNLFNDGISVKLAESGKGIGHDLTFIPSGVHALIPLRATLYNFMNDPPRFECQDGLVANTYSQNECFDDCVFKVAKEKCKCSHLVTMKPGERYPPCKPGDLFQCLYKETADFVTGYLNKTGRNIFSHCRTKCLPPCKNWEYQPTVSFATFPIRVDGIPIKSLNMTGDSIILDVFYERLEYTLIKHLPSMSTEQFVSNLGGQLGLWIGGSILSVVQIVMFCVHYIINRCGNGDGKSTNMASLRPDPPPWSYVQHNCPTRHVVHKEQLTPEGANSQLLNKIDHKPLGYLRGYSMISAKI